MRVHLYAAVVFEVGSSYARGAVGVEIADAALIITQSRKYTSIVDQVVGYNTADTDSTDIISSTCNILRVAYILFEEITLKALEAVVVLIIGETVSDRIDAFAVH